MSGTLAACPCGGGPGLAPVTMALKVQRARTLLGPLCRQGSVSLREPILPFIYGPMSLPRVLGWSS